MNKIYTDLGRDWEGDIQIMNEEAYEGF